jgi:hypothetical protein
VEQVEGIPGGAEAEHTGVVSAEVDGDVPGGSETTGPAVVPDEQRLLGLHGDLISGDQDVGLGRDLQSDVAEGNRRVGPGSASAPIDAGDGQQRGRGR